MDKKLIFLTLLVILGLVSLAQGHGMLLDPVNRASRFRYDGRAMPDWNDNGLNCGGYSLQHGTNKGKCGICGDAYSDKVPRAHELGGRWGEGTIVRSYKSGEQITASVKITANHKGYFKFDLCNMDPLKTSGKKTEEESCFNVSVKTVDGKETYLLPSTEARVYDVELQLPKGLTCKHCILRWTYTTGNSWGWCGDGTGKLGCGAQETFRTCSDIEIV